jgi:uncharacterized iron-regulated protein
MRIIASIKPYLFLALLFANGVHADTLLVAVQPKVGHPLIGKIWDMNSRRFMDEAALHAMMDKADVLLLGETHDNPQHHELQLRLLKARIDSGARPALMMEQLDTDSQPALDLALADSDPGEALNAATGLITFTDRQFYRPFLAAAIDNKLPVIAANISSQQLQPVIWNGFAAYDAAALKRMAVENVWSDSRQTFMLSHIGGAHCGQIRDELRAGLTRSQRLRDALMADAGIPSIGRGIVAIVGSSHARRDVGMPLYLAARDPAAHILSIAFVEVIPGLDAPETYETESASGSPPFDVIWFSSRVERADPCADYGKK